MNKILWLTETKVREKGEMDCGEIRIILGSLNIIQINVEVAKHLIPLPANHFS